jgi:hypothetical protein
MLRPPLSSTGIIAALADLANRRSAVRITEAGGKERQRVGQISESHVSAFVLILC